MVKPVLIWRQRSNRRKSYTSASSGMWESIAPSTIDCFAKPILCQIRVAAATDVWRIASIDFSVVLYNFCDSFGRFPQRNERKRDEVKDEAGHFGSLSWGQTTADGMVKCPNFLRIRENGSTCSWRRRSAYHIGHLWAPDIDFVPYGFVTGGPGERARGSTRASVEQRLGPRMSASASSCALRPTACNKSVFRETEFGFEMS